MTYLHSHFGVYGLITNDKKKVLLIKKARGPYTGMYDLPGGSPEPKELLEEILKREINEETGCIVTKCKQLGAFSTLFEYKKEAEDGLLRHLGVIYLTEIEGQPRTDADGEDSNGCVWLELDQLNEQNSTPFVLTAIEYIK